MTLQHFTVGTIGGPQTFAGLAAAQMRVIYPDLAEPQYFVDGEALFEAFSDGGVDVIIAAEASTGGGFSGFLDRLLAPPAVNAYVVAEATVSFACSILGRPGSALGGLTTIYGGPVSLQQAGAFMGEHLPNATVETYSSPFETAQRIADGDGGAAVLGSTDLAERFGLEVLAADVDGGALGCFWALSSEPVFVARPDRVVVAARCGEEGALGDLSSALADAGFTLLSAYSQPTGRGLFEFDYVLRLGGAGDLSAVEAAVSALPGARLAGAYQVAP